MIVAVAVVAIVVTVVIVMYVYIANKMVIMITSESNKLKKFVWFIIYFNYLNLRESTYIL